mmetsp:Transcript_35975/g.114627  ORF Transcript_35975/g.114627 Transcript_35975/m.114627 type:complete len:233 (-) Transcript_35975:2376-3074(-)
MSSSVARNPKPNMYRSWRTPNYRARSGPEARRKPSRGRPTRQRSILQAYSFSSERKVRHSPSTSDLAVLVRSRTMRLEREHKVQEPWFSAVRRSRASAASARDGRSTLRYIGRRCRWPWRSSSPERHSAGCGSRRATIPVMRTLPPDMFLRLLVVRTSCRLRRPHPPRPRGAGHSRPSRRTPWCRVPPPPPSLAAGGSEGLPTPPLLARRWYRRRAAGAAHRYRGDPSLPRL